MHFHLPKPLHGWREFVGEVGIIVIGVLIALGAEQVVVTLDWREKVRAGEETLRKDYVFILANAEERKREDPCLRARLLELRNILDTHPDSLPALGHIGSPPRRPWYPGSWDGLVASDVSTHMPRDETLALSSIAQQARIVEDSARIEFDDWNVLYTMVGPARALAPGEAAQLRKALTVAAAQLNWTRINAPQIAQDILDIRLLHEDDFNRVRQIVSTHMNGPNAHHICGPIASPDPNRVDAPYDPAVQPNPLFGRKTLRRG